MSTFIVAYESVYGSTAQYAEALAQRLGVAACGFEQASKDAQLQPDAVIIALSYVHGPVNPGAKFLVDTDLNGHRTALCTVGMTLDDVVQKKDPAAKSLGNKAEQIKRFYLPGRLNYSELTTAHRTTMWTITNMLKAKPLKNANDKMMISTFDSDVDRVDLHRLDEVEAWARS